jgi:hypothetical protein
MYIWQMVLLRWLSADLVAMECITYSLRSFLYSPVTSSLLGSYIPSTPYSQKILSPRSSLNANDQVSHPYITMGKIMVLHILIFKIFGQKTGRQNILHRMIASIAWLQSALNFILNRILIVKFVPKYLNTVSTWITWNVHSNCGK